MNPTPHRKDSGLSFVEMVILVSVIGLLASLGISRVGMGSLEAAREVKLEQDLRVLNSAVTAYLASGGDLSKTSSPGEVLVRLKTRASEEQRRRLPGLGGSFLDGEVEFEFQSDDEANSDALRLTWSGQRKRFELVRGGAGGIRKVVMNRSGAAGGGESEEVRTSGMQFSSESTWIWDYQDLPLPLPGAPSAIPTGETPSSLPTPPVKGSVPVARSLLQPPVFSIPGGRFPEFDFPLSLTLTDPNPPGAGQIYYSVNYGSWQKISSGDAIPVASESSIKAQVVAVDSTIWNSSSVNEELYYAYSQKLRPPDIDFDHPYFDSSSSPPVDTITVSLFDLNDPGLSSILYQLVPVPGGSGTTSPMVPYKGPFTVTASDYPEGFGVKAYASAAKVGYEDSRMNTRFATSQKGVFGGHLDLDTSTTLASIANGSTDAHTHDITGKYGIHTLDFFAIPESSQIEINEAITDPSQPFKLTVVNANLSPGMSLIIDYEVNGSSRTLDTTVGRYDDTALKDLTVFSLGGTSGTARLKRLQMVMGQDVIHEASVIPTVTGEVKANTLGKANEWRNGALTIQAVSINSDGSDGFTTDTALSNGDQGAARSGLLWEAALFWHWGGDSYDDAKNTYVPGQRNTVESQIK
ncbi:MAG: type II secretion system protein [Verrucomicrobiae bacterium]|nr:type II secretion system protein [Verrucomicrobiae bacterium]